LSDLGYVSLLRGNLPEAKSYFVSALEADPKFPYAQTNLGYAYLAEGRYEAARNLFSKLIQDEELKRNSSGDIQ
jgi:Flp pilus assembly protein TadD